jgi:hypothetical protein
MAQPPGRRRREPVEDPRRGCQVPRQETAGRSAAHGSPRRAGPHRAAASPAASGCRRGGPGCRPSPVDVPSLIGITAGRGLDISKGGDWSAGPGSAWWNAMLRMIAFAAVDEDQVACIVYTPGRYRSIPPLHGATTAASVATVVAGAGCAARGATARDATASCAPARGPALVSGLTLANATRSPAASPIARLRHGRTPPVRSVIGSWCAPRRDCASGPMPPGPAGRRRGGDP